MKIVCKNEQKINKYAICPKLKKVESKNDLETLIVDVCDSTGYNKDIIKTKYFKKLCKPGCKSSKNEQLSKKKFISKELINIWDQVCDKEKSYYKSKKECIKQRLYDVQCRSNNIKNSTCIYANFYPSIKSSDSFIKFCPNYLKF